MSYLSYPFVSVIGFKSRVELETVVIHRKAPNLLWLPFWVIHMSSGKYLIESLI